ncbi:hypothetical protein GCM10011583_09800 [Streptomyces camponoticapitis]|uniref:Uncharacterized protein n=1 Tax=Streptomyces camponoticapitis TaxID=1616125 RepID=A0ABQ2E0N5_9ACTN|nr:hypothetical protein GCM10011583_09800 [Streptomyces camponoticapitis]
MAAWVLAGVFRVRKDPSGLTELRARALRDRGRDSDVEHLHCSYEAITDTTCSATTLSGRRDEWIRLGVLRPDPGPPGCPRAVTRGHHRALYERAHRRHHRA